MLMKIIKWFPLPNGWKSKIACFFQSKFTVSSLVVIFNKKQEVLLFEHTYRSIPWGLPGGFVNNKEHPESSVVREIFEESGLTVSNTKLLSVNLDTDLSRLTVCYYSRESSGDFQSSNEVSRMKYFALSDIPNLPEGQKRIIKEAIRQL